MSFCNMFDDLYFIVKVYKIKKLLKTTKKKKFIFRHQDLT